MLERKAERSKKVNLYLNNMTEEEQQFRDYYETEQDNDEYNRFNRV